MKSTRRIAWILGLVFLLPALFFSVYEISSLNRDEEMIQQVYAKQLEALLFSVNQYSDDVVNSWIGKIENGLEETVEKDSTPLRIKEVLGFNGSIYGIFRTDTTRALALDSVFTRYAFDATLLRKIDSALISNEDKISQLIAYRRSGFQKVDVLEFDWNHNPQLHCLFFITMKPGKNPELIGILVDPELFILDVVGPRLQVIARDQFILSVFNTKVAAPVYSTVRDDNATLAAEAQTKNLWLLPDYTLGIRTKESSLQEVIDKRTTTNLYLLIALNIVLILAVWMVFRNVKREVQLAQNKADFVSNVSHEIRTPLALISMFAETLEMGRAPTEDKKQEYYSIISKEANRLTGIVNKILNFSQTEANKKILRPTALNVSEAVQSILKTYDFHLRSKGFEYQLTTPPDELIIHADHEAFSEVMINLIDNAMKYSVDAKRIEISFGRDQQQGFVAVKDYGIGISANDQKHIFDKFYRVSSGNLAKSQGTGIGLALVKQLVEAQRGKVHVLSELGIGSTFTLYFPLEENQINTNG